MSNAGKTLGTLTKRVSDMMHAVKVCVEEDDQLEAIRSVIELKWIPIPLRTKWTANSIAKYLWAKGVRP